MTARIYLDWNATTPLRPEARAAMAAALDVVGNPSSIHAEGRAARALVDAAREQVAELVGAEPRNVIFTSGGTEANNLALTPLIEDGAAKAPCGRLLVSAIEHPSVHAGGRFAPDETAELPVSADGVVNLARLAQELDAVSQEFARNSAGVFRLLAAIMLANNETGVIQPVAEAARLIHAAGGLLVVDAVQAAGKIPCNINELGADFLTLSAHKIGGPKGVGALIKARESLHIADPLIRGGGQERGARGGTENICGISSFGAAAAAAHAALAEREAPALRHRLEKGLTEIARNTVIFGANSPRLPNTTLFAVPGVKAETALIALDLVGIAVSAGSACSSGKVGPSHVLAAMGVAPALASSAIRVSAGPTTTAAEIDFFLETWRKHLATLSKGGRGVAA